MANRSPLLRVSPTQGALPESWTLTEPQPLHPATTRRVVPMSSLTPAERMLVAALIRQQAARAARQAAEAEAPAARAA